MSDPVCYGWEIVCPDGKVRHYPFHDEDDAKAEAMLASSQRCRLWSAPSDLETSQPPCPEGEHTVRLVEMHRMASRPFA